MSEDRTRFDVDLPDGLTISFRGDVRAMDWLKGQAAEMASIRAEVARLRKVVEQVYKSSNQKHIIELTRDAATPSQEPRT
jgi:hypothetical protein